MRRRKQPEPALNRSPRTIRCRFWGLLLAGLLPLAQAQGPDEEALYPPGDVAPPPGYPEATYPPEEAGPPPEYPEDTYPPEGTKPLPEYPEEAYPPEGAEPPPGYPEETYPPEEAGPPAGYPEGNYPPPGEEIPEEMPENEVQPGWTDEPPGPDYGPGTGEEAWPGEAGTESFDDMPPPGPAEQPATDAPLPEATDAGAAGFTPGSNSEPTPAIHTGNLNLWLDDDQCNNVEKLLPGRYKGKTLHKFIYKLPQGCAAAYSFVIAGSQVAIDVDGAPNAYAPRGKTCNGQPPLDGLGSAGYPGTDWWDEVLVSHRQNNGNKVPVTQGSTDPCPGFFISMTSLKDSTGRCSSGKADLKRYVDGSQIPYLVFPGNFLKKEGSGRLGDIGFACNLENGRGTGFIVADVSGKNKPLKEISMGLANALGGNVTDARSTRGVAQGKMLFIVFPYSSPAGKNSNNPRWPVDLSSCTSSYAGFQVAQEQAIQRMARNLIEVRLGIDTGKEPDWKDGICKKLSAVFSPN